MLPRVACLVLTLLFLAFTSHGCASHTQPERPSGNLNFYDQAGQFVATGNLRDVPLPVYNGAHFAAHWRLLWSQPTFPKSAMADGDAPGTVDAGVVSIDLHRPVADNNVVLTGTVKGNVYSGTWYHATVSGGNPMGRFEAFLAVP